MPRTFEELDYQETPMGPLSLRRKEILELGGREVFEVTLGDEFLMSSLFHDAEVALAELALARLPDTARTLEVAIGGLGLGFTAAAALADPRVASLVVVEALAPVIRWHRERLVPLGQQLCSDARCALSHADFFAEFGSPPRDGVPRFDAVLLDIDHSPEALLDNAHRRFYNTDGIRAMAAHLRPGGVFGMWSDGAPLEGFVALLGETFNDVHPEVVSFPNPILGGRSSSTVYLATDTRPEQQPPADS